MEDNRKIQIVFLCIVHTCMGTLFVNELNHYQKYERDFDNILPVYSVQYLKPFKEVVLWKHKQALPVFLILREGKMQEISV